MATIQDVFPGTSVAESIMTHFETGANMQQTVPSLVDQTLKSINNTRFNELNLGSPYLSPSAFTDSESKIIAEISRTLTSTASNEKERSVQIFNWVRDEIKYKVGLYDHKASDTLLTQYGSCSNKANLLVSLLRSIGIPSGFIVMQVYTKKYFGNLCLQRFSKFFNDISVHVLASIYLDGAWILVDPTDDMELSSNTSHINKQSTPVFFDGESHALLQIDNSHITSISEAPLANIDPFFKKSRRISENTIFIFNQYMDFIRRNGKKYLNLTRLEQDFFNLLMQSYPSEYKKFILEELSLENQDKQDNSKRENPENVSKKVILNEKTR